VRMRVAGGDRRGFPLRTPRRARVRPTPELVRSALFNALRGVAGARVLDLYAGVGAVGIEALSRGARHAVFVERDRVCLSVLRENLRATGLADRARVVAGDAIAAVAQLGRQGTGFDLVFLDPPYDLGLVEPTLRALAREGLVREGGLAVAQHPRREVPPQSVDGLVLVRTRSYGDTCLSFYRATDPSVDVPTASDTGGGLPEDSGPQDTNG